MVEVKPVIMYIACDSSVDPAEEVQIALSKSAVFTDYDYLQGGCVIVSEPVAEDGWSAEEYENMTGVDVLNMED